MINVVQHWKLHVFIAFVCLFLSVGVAIFWHKNYGIDMTWGTQSEYNFTGGINIEDISSKLTIKKDEFNTLNNTVINGISAYKISWEDKMVVEVWFNTASSEKELDTLKTNFQIEVTNFLKTQNPSFELSKYINIGKSFWDYIKKTAILTLVIALIGIVVYIWFAFYGIASWIPSISFALVVLFTQLVDVMTASGLYIFSWFWLSEFKIDTFFITALLTILWYSINNTIVVFDRVRENIKKHMKTKKLDEIINLSIKETFRRWVYTTSTLFFVLCTIFFFGPESLGGFMLVMIYWVVFGIYSSLFVAGSFLYLINKDKELKIVSKKKLSNDDKIVV